MIRAETAAAALNNAGEKVSDGLLIAMCLKGLPGSYTPFITVITQRTDEQTFAEFKVSLRSFEETMNAQRTDHGTEESVMGLQGKGIKGRCFKCNRFGHSARECRVQHQLGDLQSQTSAACSHGNGAEKRWCSYHNSGSHSNEQCLVQKSKHAIKHFTDDKQLTGETAGTPSQVFDF